MQITDGFSEWRWADVRVDKSELTQAAIDIARHSKTMCGRHPRLIISDLGSEFDNRALREYCRRKGITLQASPPRAKELNGLAEKNADTTKNHARAMLLAAHMPEQLGWSRAVAHHVYVWNRTHINRHTGRTPHEMMTGREPSILNLGVFGCDAYVHQDKSQRDTTFSPKALPAIYLGHSGRENCPVVYMLHSGKIVSAKDVMFREGTFTHVRAVRKGRESTVGAIDLDEIALETSDYQNMHLPSPMPAATNAAFDDDDAHAEADADDDQEYQVEAITGEGIVDGQLKYRVQWKGYDEPSWEPASELKDVAALDEWEKQRDEARPTRIILTRSAAAAAARAKNTIAESPDTTQSDDDDEKHSMVAARGAAAQRV
jgi:hypothetical protein